MKPTQAPLLYEYVNGNVKVSIYSDGTKVREWPDDQDPWVSHPESCDLKITQYCNLASVCKYCHEASDKKGKHGDLTKILNLWQDQFPGTELAIGGGNPLAHPGLIPFLRIMRQRGIIPNLTVNALHVRPFLEDLQNMQMNNLIFGLGISYRGKDSLESLPRDLDYRNVVHHLILGIHTLDDCTNVIEWSKKRRIHPKILLLGYKTYGRGKGFYSPAVQRELDNWKDNSLQRLLDNDLTLSFDNLAISQLDLKNQIDQSTWELLYQGDDGQSTFYCDAVEGTVARTSTSDVRFKFEDNDTVQSIFSKVKINHENN